MLLDGIDWLKTTTRSKPDVQPPAVHRLRTVRRRQ